MSPPPGFVCYENRSAFEGLTLKQSLYLLYKSSINSKCICVVANLTCIIIANQIFSRNLGNFETFLVHICFHSAQFLFLINQIKFFHKKETKFLV